LLQRIHGDASRAAMMRRILAGIIFAVATIAAVGLMRGASAEGQPARPKITGIDHARLYVSDVAKSKAFYSGALGLPNAGGNCGGKTRPCFAVNSSQYVELEPVPSPAPKNWVAEIAFATEDANGLAKYLSTRGVDVAVVTEGNTGPTEFEVRDPEGNLIEFVQRPAKTTDFKVSPRQISNRMLHAGFVVKDMAAENKFYRDILGFRTYWYGGFKDNDIDWYEIQVPDGSDWIEFMLNIPANADHKELGVQNHFSLGVKDAGVAAAQLRKQGLTKFDGPEVGRDGKNSLDAYDPDGTRVEVMEFTPRQTPCCHAYEAAHPSP
jgi:catechol 2,3-dioxygenase-like lactoylglutathione lyase family enzyme